MRRAKLVDTEKARSIAMIEQGVPVTQVAADLKISRQAIYNLIKAVRSLPKGAIPRRRQGGKGKHPGGLMPYADSSFFKKETSRAAGESFNSYYSASTSQRPWPSM